MYTGILVRSGSHADFESVDPLVDRELALSQFGLGVGIDRGSGVESFWLNYSALSKINSIAADGTITPGFKTSDIPVTYDTSKLLYTVNGFSVDGNLLHNSLSYISSISAVNITFTDKGGTPTLTSLNIADLKTASSAAPILSGPTTVEVTTNLDNTVIEDEAGTVIGTGNIGPITITTQSSSDRIYAYTIDTSKNKSIRSSILIP